MTKIITAIVAAAGLAVLAPSAMATQPPDTQDPCAPGHNPTTLCGDTISVDDPTAEECPTGGQVLVINDVRYPICNGADGTNGADGAAGAPGTAGTDGADGTNGADGAAGAPGATGATGATGVTGSDGLRGVAPAPVAAARKCVSKRRFSITLRTKALRHAKRVVVRVAGKRVVMRPNKSGRVRIDLSGLAQGVYAVVVRNGGGADSRVYTVCAAGNVSNYTNGHVA
jgi:hypothetical protein